MSAQQSGSAVRRTGWLLALVACLVAGAAGFALVRRGSAPDGEPPAPATAATAAPDSESHARDPDLDESGSVLDTARQHIQKNERASTPAP